jgi:siroheme synthase
VGIRSVPAIQAALLGADLPIEAIAEAETPRQRVLRATLGATAGDLAHIPALILIRHRKTAGAVRAVAVAKSMTDPLDLPATGRPICERFP